MGILRKFNYRSRAAGTAAEQGYSLQFDHKPAGRKPAGRKAVGRKAVGRKPAGRKPVGRKLAGRC